MQMKRTDFGALLGTIM